MPREKALSPEEFLGFRVGTERKVADWPEIVAYFEKLAKSSDKIKFEVLGETTEKNPFVLATISAPKNLANLEKYREIQNRLCDPKNLTEEEAAKLVEEGKTIVLVTCSIHSTEIGACQMSMELAHRLITEDSPDINEILDNVIFLLVPSLNPDGTMMVVKWYKETLGTKAEGTTPPFLYHKYVGHDNNRDWFMFTQKETRLTVEKIHNRWHPQIVYDLHQMGKKAPRLYVPPFMDPFEPNIDPALVVGSSFMGISMANELIGEGKEGIAFFCIYDAWTPGRAYQHYHNGIRVLSEAASADIATPVEVKKEELEYRGGVDPKQFRWNNPLPWRGGRWTLRDIVDYELIAVFACLRNAARYRERWLYNTLQMGKRALNPEKGPYAFIIPQTQKDPATTAELVNVLITGDVQVHRAKKPFEAEGVKYPAGTYVVLFVQPFGRFAKAMLEIQKYPDLRERPNQPPVRPYDVTAHTLGLLMDVEVHQADEAFSAELEAVEKAKAPAGEIRGGGDKPFYAFSSEMNISAKAANALLEQGLAVSRVCDWLQVGREKLLPGAFLVEGGAKTAKSVARLAADYGITFYGVERAPKELMRLGKSRVGIYKAWMPNADEGWMRFVLENFGFGFQSLTPQDIREGGLADKFDIVIFPDLARDIIVNGMGAASGEAARYPLKYRMGIGKQGIDELRKFLKAGGTILTINDACAMPIKDLWIAAENAVEGLKDEDIYILGSLLRVVMDNTHPLGYGFDREAAVFFDKSPAFNIKDGVTVAKYPQTNPLLSGFILGEKHLMGRTAVADISAGRGRVVLIGFSPHFRSQTHGTFKLLFNAIFYAAGEKV